MAATARDTKAENKNENDRDDIFDSCSWSQPEMRQLYMYRTIMNDDVVELNPSFVHRPPPSPLPDDASQSQSDLTSKSSGLEYIEQPVSPIRSASPNASSNEDGFQEPRDELKHPQQPQPQPQPQPQQQTNTKHVRFAGHDATHSNAEFKKNDSKIAPNDAFASATASAPATTFAPDPTSIPPITNTTQSAIDPPGHAMIAEKPLLVEPHEPAMVAEPPLPHLVAEQPLPDMPAIRGTNLTTHEEFQIDIGLRPLKDVFAWLKANQEYDLAQFKPTDSLYNEKVQFAKNTHRQQREELLRYLETKLDGPEGDELVASLGVFEHVENPLPMRENSPVRNLNHNENNKPDRKAAAKNSEKGATMTHIEVLSPESPPNPHLAMPLVPPLAQTNDAKEGPKGVLKRPRRVVKRAKQKSLVFKPLDIHLPLPLKDWTAMENEAQSNPSIPNLGNLPPVASVAYERSPRSRQIDELRKRSKRSEHDEAQSGSEPVSIPGSGTETAESDGTAASGTAASGTEEEEEAGTGDSASGTASGTASGHAPEEEEFASDSRVTRTKPEFQHDYFDSQAEQTKPFLEPPRGRFTNYVEPPVLYNETQPSYHAQQAIGWTSALPKPWRRAADHFDGPEQWSSSLPARLSQGGVDRIVNNESNDAGIKPNDTEINRQLQQITEAVAKLQTQISASSAKTALNTIDEDHNSNEPLPSEMNDTRRFLQNIPARIKELERQQAQRKQDERYQSFMEKKHAGGGGKAERKGDAEPKSFRELTQNDIDTMSIEQLKSIFARESISQKHALLRSADLMANENDLKMQRYYTKHVNWATQGSKVLQMVMDSLKPKLGGITPDNLPGIVDELVNTPECKQYLHEKYIEEAPRENTRSPVASLLETFLYKLVVDLVNKPSKHILETAASAAAEGRQWSSDRQSHNKYRGTRVDPPSPSPSSYGQPKNGSVSPTPTDAANTTKPKGPRSLPAIFRKKQESPETAQSAPAPAPTKPPTINESKAVAKPSSPRAHAPDSKSDSKSPIPQATDSDQESLDSVDDDLVNPETVAELNASQSKPMSRANVDALSGMLEKIGDMAHHEK